ncbi:DNA repair exonuclease SbcCD nuclease subunit [Lentzea fradiae]|uniref:DNA repair exonuclease SbcCD nuclease subunit n=1 Tax=Lentzea fradiae TaxID=200378 RepID=A0A1G7SC30_9PSEU|nr:DNA repair exonuclease [Lentzea fradiae]SDG20474.1 DNA repair exonuclease SbcCD nuclease subunit [Lentzea fradiae]
MTGVRIVHAADIHLDSPLRGLSRFADEDLAQHLRLASRRALENLVKLVVDKDAQALVLAGDIYDGDWKDYATGQFFARQMDLLDQHRVRVFMVAGNHDAASVVTKAVPLPGNVTVMSTDQPQLEIDDDLGLAVHGQGFAARDVHDNLVLAYPDRVDGLVNVGILHTAVSGAEGHARYAPCAPADLERKAYEYFALGHVHTRRVVNEDHWVAAFSGNLQGRHVNETGPKGALVVDLAVERKAELSFEPLDVARWGQVQVDATGLRSVDDVYDAVARRLAEERATTGDRPLLARVTIIGETAAAGALSDRVRLTETVRPLAERTGVTIEKAVSHARAPRSGSRVEERLLDAVLRRRQELTEDLGPVHEMAKMPNRDFGFELRRSGLLDLLDDDALRGITTRAMDDLLAKMSSEVN